MNITFELNIFEVVSVQNFTLKKQFWILITNLPKKDIFTRKRKEWRSSLNPPCLNYSWYKISAETNNIDFSKHIFLIRVFLVWKKTSEQHYGSLPIQIFVGTRFQIKLKILIFALNSPERVFPIDNRKNEHHLRILYIWISLGTKFKLKLKFLIIWTKFVQKRFFR